ncbi:MAG: glycosyltransferase [Candidatus Bathyarchaeota archaeon]|nr:glycosyltransferase [Candidatus Bathyarchaeota archaeon]
MCTWNEARMVLLAVESTKDFVDRYIIVDKGSEDGTIELLKKCRDEWKLAMDIYIKPHLIFPEARLFGYQKADEDWILVQDGDEVFHTDGPNSIFHLRKYLRLKNVVYAAPKIVLRGDFLHTDKVFPVMAPHHFLFHNNGTFHIRKGDEAPRFIGVTVYLRKAYIFNCHLKSGKRVFLMLNFWREWCIESEAYKKYSSLEEYAKAKLGVDNIDQIAEEWYRSRLVPYDEQKFGYYPKVIRKYIKMGMIRGYVQDRVS